MGVVGTEEYGYIPYRRLEDVVDAYTKTASYISHITIMIYAGEETETVDNHAVSSCRLHLICFGVSDHTSAGEFLLYLLQVCLVYLMWGDNNLHGKAPDAPHGVREELGDALFMAAKLAQMTHVDPEDALHRACDKFDSRFRFVESGADKPLADCTKEELLALWRAAKEQES